MSSEFRGTGAQLLVEALVASGVEVVFGVPGDTGVSFYDALYRAEGRLRHVLARDERHAASMADAYARVAGRVGVVEASSGGGATFLVGGLGEPYAASVPVLVLTSDIHRQSRGSGAITEIDQGRLFAAVTKWRATAECAADVPRLVREALTAALDGRPAPVSLVFPEDVLDEEASAAVAGGPIRLGDVPPPAPDEEDLRAVAASLRRAERPAVLAGSGVHLSRAWDALKAFAEAQGVAVATTIHGKGSLAEDHPLALGVAGANGAREYANRYLASADWVLFVGTRANATDTNGFTAPPRGTTTAHVDVDPSRAAHNYPAGRAIVGDARAALLRLTELAGPPALERRRAVEAWIRAERETWEREELEATRGIPTEPRAVVQALQDEAEPGSVLVVDAGTPTPYVAAFWQAETGRRVIIPRGHGAMGFAIPASIGAALASEGRRVYCLTTDGSFAMAVGELETVRRLGLPITFLHFANGTYGWIKMLQRLYEGERYFGVDFTPVDTLRIVEGFGLPAARAESIPALRSALRAAARSKGPAFIDIPTPAETDLLAPVAPWTAALAGDRRRPVY